jgi:hypothetical protein
MHVTIPRDATPLLFFPTNLVAQKLDEIESSSRPEDEARILQICLYQIEREFNFTSDGLFTGRHNTNISNPLNAEVDKYRKRPVTTECERSKTLTPPRRPQLGSKFSSPKGCLQAKAYLFSSQSALSESPDHYFQKRMFFSGFRGFVLPNPFTWIQVESELIRLQTEWDPSFKKTEFIHGTKHVGNSGEIPPDDEKVEINLERDHNHSRSKTLTI